MLKKRRPALAALLALASALPACSRDKKADCATPEVFCVGLVTDMGKIDDKSFNQSAWEALQRAQKELGATTQYIETTDPKDYPKNIGTFADEKYDVIVTSGFGLTEATHAAAAQFAATKFIGIDQFQAPGAEKPNVVGLIFPEDHGGFLVGALAAMMTKTGKIGAVLATDAVPPVWRFGEGFRAGARHVKPDVELSVVYHNDVGFDKTFTDPEWGKTTAVSMIDKGVDIVFGGGGKTGNGALLGAATKGAYAIGVDTDQYYTVPEAQKVLLSSAVKLIADGTFDLIKTAKEGKLPSGNFTGKSGYAPYHDLDGKVPAEVKAKMEELRKALLDGTLKTGVPPTKPGQ
ncbi:BMP family ABC transporter substrate-binding protein [Sorangium sp. So ce315]|uniref:BMP family lipoprotein n=1 Tax=Sorangium sp. So ce315 TaxID=3133299 RepID=UPI003F6161B2